MILFYFILYPDVFPNPLAVDDILHGDRTAPGFDNGAGRSRRPIEILSRAVCSMYTTLQALTYYNNSHRLTIIYKTAWYSL